MKYAVCFVVLTCLLSGCNSKDTGMDTVVNLRKQMLQMQNCSFQAEIHADYGDITYDFQAECDADREGNLAFTVLEPSSISGISGTVSHSGGKLTFADTVLAFPLLAEGEVSPVSAPWLLIRTLMSGYVSATVQEGERLHVTFHDSYEADALTLEVWLDDDEAPCFAEIVWQGRRVLSMHVTSFEIV